MTTVRTWLGMAWAIIIHSCCYFTSYNQAANLISNPSFEDSDLHVWKFQKRQSLWDLTTIEPDQTGNVNQSITISKSRALHGHRSLMMTWEHSKHQQSQDFTSVLLAAQFISLNRNDAKGFYMRYRHWYSGKSSCWKFVADIRYKDLSYHHVEYDGHQHAKDNNDSNDTFRPFCIDIPLYKSVRNMMIAIVYHIHNPHCQQELHIDNVVLKMINKTSDSKSKGRCYLEQNSYPVYRQTWKRFQISQFTLHKLAKAKDTYITIATQMTIDRLPHLETLVKRWQGPISAVLFVINDVQGATVQHQLHQVLQKYHQTDDFRKFIDMHIVFEDMLNKKDAFRYPVNYLRNIAIKYSTTSHVYLLDVDILPSFNHDQAVASITKASQDINGVSHDSKLCQKCAFITPLFKAKVDIEDANYPTNKGVLVEQTRKDKPVIEPFYTISHSMTQFSQWFNSAIAFKTQYFKNNEPYFIINKRLSPNINNMFSGYGRDKCVYAHEVNVTGFEFVVLPDMFAIDKPTNENFGILHRTLNHGELLPIQVFLNTLFHVEEVNLVYTTKQRIAHSKDRIKVTNKHSESINQTSTKKAGKVKKATQKKDMSGFGCKDTLISGTQSSTQASRPQYVIVEKMLALYGTMMLIEFFSGGMYPMQNTLSHLESNIILKQGSDHQSISQENIITKEIYGNNMTNLVQQVTKDKINPLLFWISTKDRSQDTVENILIACLQHANKRDIIIIEDGRQESLDAYQKLMCQYKNKWRIKIEETVTLIKSPKVTGRPPIKLPPIPAMTRNTDPPRCDDIRLVTELILFTRNRPMHTLAFFESLSHIASGLDKIWVLLRADPIDFQKGYQYCFECLKNMTKFNIQVVVEEPGQFGRKLLEILHNSTADYMIYAVDEIIWLRPVNFSYAACQLHIAKGKIASMQLRLGENIRPVRYVEEQAKFKEQIFPVKYDSEILLMYPLTLPYDSGYIVHVDGIMMSRQQMLEDSTTFLPSLNNPMDLENTWIWRKLPQRCRQWHLSYKTSRLVNNVLSDGRILNQIKPSQESQKLLKMLLKDGKRVDVKKARQQFLHHSATHTSRPVEYIDNSCPSKR